jgi:hypothetical protein
MPMKNISVEAGMLALVEQKATLYGEGCGLCMLLVILCTSNGCPI